MVEMRQLEAALALSWGEDTAHNRDWNPLCPALNQCAITAMIVQDYFNGELMRCPTEKGDSHYWNRLEDGQQVGLTDSQFIFSGDKLLYEFPVIRTRNYLESNPDTLARYIILSRRVRTWLDKLEGLPQ